LSRVEWNLIFEDKYSDTGYVEYMTRDGNFFRLRPSPFLENKKSSIYFTGSSTPPPQFEFIEVDVIKEEKIKKSGLEPTRSVKTIDKWKLFDPTPLAKQRPLIDREEITSFFSEKYSGDKELVEEIINCSLLYSFSSPSNELNSGGVNSAVFGRKFQWDYFKFPLRIIPADLKKEKSDYYYYISDKEKRGKSIKSREKSFAVLRPEKLISDIPIVLDETSEKKFSKDKRENFSESSEIIAAYLLDSLLLKPESSKKEIDQMTESVYKLNDDYKKSGYVAYKQNLGDAIPKLSAAFARFHHNSQIKKEDVICVTDLWADMHYRATKYCRTPLKIAQMYELSGDARKLYIELNEKFGVDYDIPIKEAFEATTLGYDDFILSIYSLCERGFCMRRKDTIRLIEQ